MCVWVCEIVKYLYARTLHDLTPWWIAAHPLKGLFCGFYKRQRDKRCVTAAAASSCSFAPLAAHVSPCPVSARSWTHRRCTSKGARKWKARITQPHYLALKPVSVRTRATPGADFFSRRTGPGSRCGHVCSRDLSITRQQTDHAVAVLITKYKWLPQRNVSGARSSTFFRSRSWLSLTTMSIMWPTGLRTKDNVWCVMWT